MPRYYFDVRDGDELMVDNEGVEFDDLEAARREGATGLAEMALGILPSATERQIVMEVRSEQEGILLRCSLSFDVQRLQGTG